jgi:hypothetical protein
MTLAFIKSTVASGEDVAHYSEMKKFVMIDSNYGRVIKEGVVLDTHPQGTNLYFIFIIQKMIWRLILNFRKDSTK